VQTAQAPARVTHAGHGYWFCSDRCAERFSNEPARYADARSDPDGS